MRLGFTKSHPEMDQYEIEWRMDLALAHDPRTDLGYRKPGCDPGNRFIHREAVAGKPRKSEDEPKQEQTEK